MVVNVGKTPGCVGYRSKAGWSPPSPPLLRLANMLGDNNTTQFITKTMFNIVLLHGV